MRSCEAEFVIESAGDGLTEVEKRMIFEHGVVVALVIGTVSVGGGRAHFCVVEECEIQNECSCGLDPQRLYVAEFWRVTETARSRCKRSNLIRLLNRSRFQIQQPEEQVQLALGYS